MEATQAQEEQQTETSTEQPQEEAPEAAAKPEAEGAEGGEQQEEPKTSEEPAAEAPKVLTLNLGDDDDDVGEPPPPTDPKANAAWIGIKRENKESKSRIKELEAKIAALTTPVVETLPELGPEPTLRDEDVHFDGEKLKAKFLRWTEAKRKHDERAQKAKAEQERAAKEWEDSKASYATKVTKLKAEAPRVDFDAAEAFIRETFTPAQQSIMVDALDDAAKVFVSLAQNPSLAKQTASIGNHIKFTAAIVRAEKDMKTMASKKPANAEKKITSAAEKSGTDKLDSLYERAQKSGDFTEYLKQKARLEGGAKKASK